MIGLWILAGAALWVLLSTLLIVSAAMFSSCLSESEGQSRWRRAATPAPPRHQPEAVGPLTRASNGD